MCVNLKFKLKLIEDETFFDERFVVNSMVLELATVGVDVLQHIAAPIFFFSYIIFVRNEFYEMMTITTTTISCSVYEEPVSFCRIVFVEVIWKEE